MNPPGRPGGEFRNAHRSATVPAPRRARAGVALIEVLIALLVVSFGLLGLVGLQTRAHQYSASAEDTNRAALLANDIASAMWVSQSASVPGTDYAAWQARVAAAADGLPNGTGTVTTAGNTATITVSWKPPRAAAAAASSRFVTQVLIP